MFLKNGFRNVLGTIYCYIATIRFVSIANPTHARITMAQYALSMRFRVPDMANSSQPNYHAYLLRLWRADENGIWHATLQDPHTGQFLRFDSVESLYAYLQQQLGETLQPEPVVPHFAAESSSVTVESNL